MEAARRARLCGSMKDGGCCRTDRPTAPGGATNCRRQKWDKPLDGYSKSSKNLENNQSMQKKRCLYLGYPKAASSGNNHNTVSRITRKTVHGVRRAGIQRAPQGATCPQGRPQRGNPKRACPARKKRAEEAF